VEILEREDYASAIEALYWKNQPMSPSVLKKQVTTFFKSDDDQPLSAVIPLQVFNEKAESYIELEWDNFARYGDEDKA